MDINPMPQELIDAGLTSRDVIYDCLEDRWVVVKDEPKVRIPLVGRARVHASARETFGRLQDEFAKLGGTSESERGRAAGQ